METISGAVVSVRAETPNTVLRKRKQKKRLNKKGFLKGKEREREKFYLASTIVLRVSGTTDSQTKCLIVESENAPRHLSACYPAVARLWPESDTLISAVGSPPSRRACGADGLKINRCFMGLHYRGNVILLKLRVDQSNITGHLNCGFNFSL